MPFQREVSEPWERQPHIPPDQICRWCEYFTHADVANWWWDYRCGLDNAKVDMWGTCLAWRLAAARYLSDVPQQAIFKMLSAHEKADAVALKAGSYRIVT